MWLAINTLYSKMKNPGLPWISYDFRTRIRFDFFSKLSGSGYLVGIFCGSVSTVIKTSSKHHQNTINILLMSYECNSQVVGCCVVFVFLRTSNFDVLKAGSLIHPDFRLQENVPPKQKQNLEDLFCGRVHRWPDGSSQISARSWSGF